MANWYRKRGCRIAVKAHVFFTAATPHRIQIKPSSIEKLNLICINWEKQFYSVSYKRITAQQN